MTGRKGRRPNRSPLWRLPADREVDEELEHHLELRTREYQRRGLSREEARREALRRFGDPSGIAARCRREAKVRNRLWTVGWTADELRIDVRYALRQMLRRPATTMLLVLMLSLGLGLATIVSGMAREGLWSSLPYERSERLVTLWEAHVDRGKLKNVVSPANFLAFREQLESLEDLAAFLTLSRTLEVPGAPPVRAKIRVVTEGYLEILGIRPILGRSFAPEDFVASGTEAPAEAPGNEERIDGRVLIGSGFWKSALGGREDVVGRTLRISGSLYEILGVLPAEARLDMGPENAPMTAPADLWAPLPVREEWREPRGRWMQTVGRLAEGVGLETARAEVATVMDRQIDRHPDFNAGYSARLLALEDHLRDPIRVPLLALVGSVALVLLIVAVNASSLLLARQMGRGRELAVRRALGAGRGRLARQLLVESALLTGLGALGGLGIAHALGGLARGVLPSVLSATAEGPVPLDHLAFLALATWVVLQLLVWGPTLALGRHVPNLLRGRGTGGDDGSSRLRTGLVIAQTALAVVLLAGAALFVRTVDRLLELDPGFETEGIVAFSVTAAGDGPHERFYEQLLARLEALPGVSAAGATTSLPMAGIGGATGYQPTDRPAPDPANRPTADIRILHGDVLGALGTRLLEGRALDSSDRADAEIGSALVSRSLAERWWPEGSAVGRTLEVGWSDGRLRRIVGVVEDVRLLELATRPRDAVYFPLAQEESAAMSVAVRTTRDPASLAPEIRSAVAELDPGAPIYDVVTIRDVVEETIAPQTFLARLVGAFAVLALGLALVGVAGVIGLDVTRRTREVGLRMALGARPRSVLALFLRRAALWTALALGPGLLGAVLAGRSVEALLYGVEAADPRMLAGIALLVAATVLLAALGPARRAARTDPAVALRLD